jgi:2-amino-4-hydroxy-6-hydroxymethyldihydropteridine diphosphokinase
MHKVFLGLGSNMGNRQQTLLQAIYEIERLIGSVTDRSAFIITAPWGFRSDNDFLNAVIACDTLLSPRQVLRFTQQIERRLGRTVKSSGGIYHDRPIDIDILLYDNLHVNDYDLRIPHPLMISRPFVMQPLVELLLRETKKWD